jgi:hypothetical protein
MVARAVLEPAGDAVHCIYIASVGAGLKYFVARSSTPCIGDIAKKGDIAKLTVYGFAFTTLHWPDTGRAWGVRVGNIRVNSK